MSRDWSHKNAKISQLIRMNKMKDIIMTGHKYLPLYSSLTVLIMNLIVNRHFFLLTILILIVRSILIFDFFIEYFFFLRWSHYRLLTLLFYCMETIKSYLGFVLFCFYFLWRRTKRFTFLFLGFSLYLANWSRIISDEKIVMKIVLNVSLTNLMEIVHV